jgi:hypothetical protein
MRQIQVGVQVLDGPVLQKLHPGLMPVWQQLQLAKELFQKRAGNSWPQTARYCRFLPEIVIRLRLRAPQRISFSGFFHL